MKKNLIEKFFDSVTYHEEDLPKKSNIQNISCGLIDIYLEKFIFGYFLDWKGFTNEQEKSDYDLIKIIGGEKIGRIRELLASPDFSKDPNHEIERKLIIKSAKKIIYQYDLKPKEDFRITLNEDLNIDNDEYKSKSNSVSF